jgi:hypothetical protein
MSGGYKITWKMIGTEIACVVGGIAILWAFIYLAWYALGLREGAMFTFLMLVAMPISMAPFFQWVMRPHFARYRNRY